MEENKIAKVHRLPTDIPQHGLSRRKDNGKLMTSPKPLRI
jgi:hypothetical protein